LDLGWAGPLVHARTGFERRAGATAAASAPAHRGVAIIHALVCQAGTLLRREAGGLIAGAVILVLVVAFRVPSEATWPTGREAFCYWLPSLADPYARSDWTQAVAYVYSPAFLQAIAGLKALPWVAFLAVWTVLLLLAVRYLVGPRLWAVAIAFTAIELLGGNIHILLAVAIVVGFRYPAAWGFVLLTKVTPGVGLLWFAVRREWRSLGIALGATALVAVVSWAILPGAWADWVDVLGASATKTVGTWAAVPVPLWLRLPAAVALVTWGARTDRRWTVPVAAMLALPALWFGGASMLLAAVALAADGRRDDAPTRSGDTDGSRATWRTRRSAVPAA
jgi:GNAT superfamily N-acetyltransferase